MMFLTDYDNPAIREFKLFGKIEDRLFMEKNANLLINLKKEYWFELTENKLTFGTWINKHKDKNKNKDKDKDKNKNKDKKFKGQLDFDHSSFKISAIYNKKDK